MSEMNRIPPRCPVEWPRLPGSAPGALWELAYYSDAIGSYSSAQLESLLIEARRRNADHGVTGLLLYWDRSFFQILEGTIAGIRRIFDGFIQPAGSHRNIHLCHIGEIDRRSFGDWRMAAGHVQDSSEIDDIRAVIDSINEQDPRMATGSAGRVFMNAFAYNLARY